MCKVNRPSQLAAFILAGMAAIEFASAQPPLATPQVSPNASVSQTVGITDITVTYHRPGVKGRKIWGELVPYGKIGGGAAGQASSGAAAVGAAPGTWQRSAGPRLKPACASRTMRLAERCFNSAQFNTK